MLGGISWEGGGVGGTSPVIRTNASTPAHSNFRAVIGPIVNTSRLFGELGGECSLLGDTCRPASAAGLGGEGRMYVKESAES